MKRLLEALRDWMRSPVISFGTRTVVIEKPLPPMNIYYQRNRLIRRGVVKQRRKLSMWEVHQMGHALGIPQPLPHNRKEQHEA